MKQRNAMIAVWAALLIAIGLALAITMESSPTETKSSELKLGEKRSVAVNPDAVEVRLFVSGISPDQTPRALELIDNEDGIVLTQDQRAIVDRSLYLHRLPLDEHPAVPACFDPHHIFRYFDAKGEQIGELQVCYCCRQVRVSGPNLSLGEDEFWELDFDGLAAMLKTMDVPTDIDCRGRG